MTVGATVMQLDSAHSREVAKLAFVRMLWVALALTMLAVVLDFTFALGDIARISLDIVNIALPILVGVFTYLQQRRSKSPLRMVARMIESKNSDMQNKLVNAIDFEEELDKGPHPNISKNLMKREIGLAEEGVVDFEDRSSLRPPSLSKERNFFFLLFSVAILLCIPFFHIASVVLPRLLFPFGDFPPYSSTQLAVVPPGDSIEYGENLKVTVTASGRMPESVSLVVRGKETGSTAEFPMFDAGEGKYFQTIENVTEDFQYYAQIRRGRSKRYQLELIRYPKIEDVIVTYTYPEYTRHQSETRILAGGDIKGYAGTEVVMSVNSNRPLQGGELNVSGETLPFKPDEDGGVIATFTLEEAGTYEAFVTDIEGHNSVESLAGKIEIVPDEHPEIEIVSPGMDSFAVPDSEIPIVIEASDDLGIAKIDLYRNHNGSQDSRRTVFTSEVGELFVSVSDILELGDLGVRPGDVIEYYATVTDNNARGAQTASTQSFLLRVISFEEYREYVQSQMTATDLKESYDAMLAELEALITAQNQLREATQNLEERAEASASEANESSEEGDEGDSKAMQAQARELEARQESLSKLANELAEKFDAEADTPPIFDIEEEYKEALRDLAERLREAQEHMNDAAENMAQAGGTLGSPNTEGGAPSNMPPSLSAASESQKKAMDALQEMAQDFQEGIQKPNENLEHVAKLMMDVENFKYLYTLQQSLERQVRYYKDMAELSLDDQIRLKDLSEQQKHVEAALNQLKQLLREHADELDELVASRLQEDTEEDEPGPVVEGIEP